MENKYNKYFKPKKFVLKNVENCLVDKDIEIEGQKGGYLIKFTWECLRCKHIFDVTPEKEITDKLYQSIKKNGKMDAAYVNCPKCDFNS